MLRRFSILLTFALIAGCAGPAAVVEAPRAPGATPTLLQNPELVQRYQSEITPERLAAHLYVIASDYFEGRDTATRGQRLAALYLAGQYQSMDIAASGTARGDSPYGLAGYYQPVPLNEERVQRSNISVRVDGQTTAQSRFGLAGNDGDSYLTVGNAGTHTSDVVFMGYGIETEVYNDFQAAQQAGIETAGKWLLILGDEPMAGDGSSLITETGTVTDFTTNPFQKLRAAYQYGVPAGFLVVGDRSPAAETSIQRRAEVLLNNSGAMSLAGQGPRSPMQIPPIVTISSELANAILAPSGRTIADLQRQIDSSRQPTVMAIPDASVTVEVERIVREVQSENIIAFIEGSDAALRDEVVVLTAHYDHVGLGPGTGSDGVFNGADDDASGTVAMLQIARAFHQARLDGYGPRRSVVFLHVTAEEKGLLGSAYYTDVEPVFPLANTVANLNLDMIGRNDPTHPGGDTHYVYVIGAELISTDIATINRQANERTGLNLELSSRFNDPADPNQFYRRSDQWNFGKHNIPFIFYFTGTHEDYHQTGDEPHKVDYDKLAAITRLVFGTAWEIANRTERVRVDGPGFN
ncbi:hypothetical protein BH23BAC4_BH23BAC4_12770 [soil metagenome]